MSVDPSIFLDSPNGLPGEPDDLEWLAGLLREMMAAVAAEEGDTFRKAGMIARLSGLFLRASRAAELKRANKELARRNAELEERLAALEAGTGERETPLAPARVGVGENSAHAPHDPVGARIVTTLAPIGPGPFPFPPGADHPVRLVAGAQPEPAAAPT